MKIFKTLLITWSFIAQAGLPPTSLSGQSSATKPTTFTFKAPYSQATQISGIESLIETGSENMLVNPGFEGGATVGVANGWSNVSGTPTVTTTSSEITSGKKAQKIFLSANSLGFYQQVNIPSGIQKQGVIGITYATTVSTFQICAYKDTVEAECVPSSRLVLDGFYHTIELPIVFGTTSTGILLKSASANGTVLLDAAYIKQGLGLQGFQLDNVYSAKANGSGTLSDLSKPSWISFTSVTDTSLYTYSLSGFTVTPNCAAVINVNDATTNYNWAIVSVSSTQVQLRTRYTDTSFPAGVKYAVAHTIICQKSGNDYLMASSNVYAQSGGFSPTVQKFTSGSGTYNTPSNVTHITVRMVGGGGGGGGRSGGGGTGGVTTFGSSLLTANGGTGGSSSGGGAGGTGGTASITLPAIGTALQGGSGSGTNSTLNNRGGGGAASPFGGAGGGASVNTAGYTAIANTGSGGGGCGADGSANGSASGAGAGGYVDAVIKAPAASYAYAVGAAGTAGSGSPAGGTGGSGYIEVTEYYTGTLIGSFDGIEKCTTNGECDDTFSAKISSAGVVSSENVSGWLTSCTNASPTVCTIKTGIFTVAPNCTMTPGGNTSDMGQLTVISATSFNTQFNLNNKYAMNVSCQKTGVDYKPKTAKVASSIGVPTVPGISTEAIDTFSVSYGTTNATTVCSASPCSYLDQIGTAVTSITRASTGNYTLNLGKTYTKLKCTINAAAAGTTQGIPRSGSLSCATCSSLSFVIGNTTTEVALDAYGNILCQGSY